MTDNNHKKIIVILKCVNAIFFLLQLFYPFSIICSLFINNPNSPIGILLDVLFSVVGIIIILVAQILFIMETICLQQLFSEGYRKKMRIICFLGTIFFMFLGHIFYIATIFWRWNHDRMGREFKIYQ